MAKIGILTCTNATQDLGCSSVSSLADLRKRKGTFAEYPADEKLTLAGIINCPGCPRHDRGRCFYGCFAMPDERKHV